MYRGFITSVMLYILTFQGQLDASEFESERLYLCQAHVTVEHHDYIVSD